jgi:tetratricopeptide (TPR) repeat protein
MQKTNVFETIEEVYAYVESTERKIKTILTVDPRSLDAVKFLKKLILFCSSMSINLLQLEKLEDALSMLKTADKADAELCKQSNSLKLWQGRLLTPVILAYLYLKETRYTDSLKFLYKIYTLIQEIKESRLPIHKNIKTLTNLSTFIVLWKLERYNESENYLSSIKNLDLATIRGKNLFALVSISKAGIVCKKSKDYLSAIQICEKALSQTQYQEISWDLIKTTISVIYTQMNNNSKEDWLITNKYLTVFFITCFTPLISPGTPVLRLETNFILEKKFQKINTGHSTSRSGKEKIKNLKLEDSKTLETIITTRRSKIHTSRDKPRGNSMAGPSVYIFTPRTLAGSSKISYFSPRINKLKNLSLQKFH